MTLTSMFFAKENETVSSQYLIISKGKTPKPNKPNLKSHVTICRKRKTRKKCPISRSAELKTGYFDSYVLLVISY